MAPAKLQAPLIVTVHDLMALTYPGFFGERFIIGQLLAWLYHRIYVPRSIRRADAIVAVSEHVRRDYLSGLGQPDDGRVRVIYNGVDLERFAGVDGSATRRELGLGDAPTAILLATSPASWPPMPSATTKRPVSSMA